MNANNILFIALYPTSEELKEGMSQRIKAIDTEFENINRTYLYISLFANWKRRKELNGKIQILYVNWLLHFWIIYNTVKSFRYIYVHSIYNFKYLLGMPLNGKIITLDLHGTVPEELEFANQRLKACFYRKIERKACKLVTNLVAVSYSMADYYHRKYKLDSSVKCIVKPIFPKNSVVSGASVEIEKLKRRLDIKNTDVVFLYSGNLQKWQNFDLMTECISKMSNLNYRFIILTQELGKAKDIVSRKLNSKNVIITSVLPEQLYLYYTIAHYGFILRDDMVLNRVAAPTKLIEYLSYGLIPIVKTINIGDSVRLGYEYISYDEDLTNLPIRKSSKNEAVALEVLSMNSKNFLPDII